MRKLMWFVVAVALVACSKSSSTDGTATTIRVAAASDLSKAFTEVGQKFQAKTKVEIQFDFGSSGLLAKQIEQGAPYALYAAANKSFAEQVAKSGKCDASTIQMYARGRVVVWTPDGVDKPASLADLADPRFKRIAIANPDHAPYGVAAKQALEKAGVWDQIKDRIVLGENVQATLQYARTKNADAALVALSLSIVTDGGSALPVDPSLHAPLDQALVVCGTGPGATAAKQFADYLASAEGREIMKRYGFLLPGETAPDKTAAQ
ncbi:MAG TPA: molybdate ABC transporter substrate-binding protein [Kofleriaceae bacterium]|nr:molybdate ABC transporter substrate-binding protein [Kofleriaceae bacterium]